jgi:hypothetical protein
LPIAKFGDLRYHWRGAIAAPRLEKYSMIETGMTQTGIANAADFADALLTARKAKNILCVLVLVLLLFQLVLFFAARYKLDIGPSGIVEPAASVDSSSLTTTAENTNSATVAGRPVSAPAIDFLKYAVGLSDFLGVVLPIVLIADLWLIVSVMLLGRLLGISRLVAAFLWCVLLLALLFPWQAFLMNQTFTSTEFKIPGVLYTWSELVLRARVHPSTAMLSLLYWARFVGWPVVATLLLLAIQHHSRIGMRSALGPVPTRRVVDVGPATGREL